MKIQISQSTKHLIEALGGFVYSERGEVSVKVDVLNCNYICGLIGFICFFQGKGIMVTYWLVGLEQSLMQSKTSF